MNLSQVVAQLKSERDRLDKAIEALTGLTGQNGRSATATRRLVKRTKASNDISGLVQNLRWAKQLKKGPQAIARAKKELEVARKALAASKRS